MKYYITLLSMLLALSGLMILNLNKRIESQRGYLKDLAIVTMSNQTEIYHLNRQLDALYPSVRYLKDKMDVVEAEIGAVTPKLDTKIIW